MCCGATHWTPIVVDERLLMGRTIFLGPGEYLDGRLAKRPLPWWGRALQYELGSRTMAALIVESRDRETLDVAQ